MVVSVIVAELAPSMTMFSEFVSVKVAPETVIVPVE
jgi:hypothetical protein